VLGGLPDCSGRQHYCHGAPYWIASGWISGCRSVARWSGRAERCRYAFNNHGLRARSGDASPSIGPSWLDGCGGGRVFPKQLASRKAGAASQRVAGSSGRGLRVSGHSGLRRSNSDDPGTRFRLATGWRLRDGGDAISGDEAGTDYRPLTGPIVVFLLVVKGSLLSSGGQGNLPSIHQDFITRGWANDGQFAAALAVGQVTPGPGGLWVVAFGYLVAGIAGAAAAAVAVILPPLLVLPIGRLHRRVAEKAIVRGFIRGIVLTVAAIVPLVFLRILATYGLDITAVGIALSCFVILATRRLPVIGVIGLGTLAGLLLYR
jgi:chromate transporter